MTTLAALPDYVLISILQLAYQQTEPLVWSEYGGCSPFRTVVPLVSKRWREIVRSPGAAKLLFARIRISDNCVLPAKRFSPQRLLDWFAARSFAVQELEVDLSPSVLRPGHLYQLSDAVGQVLSRCINLRVLKLTGQLQLGPLFEKLGPCIGSLRHLTSVYLARGGDGWEVQSCIRQLQGAPQLEKLQIKFASEAEPPADLPSALCALSRLQHLCLTYPFPAALPPLADLPAELASLSRLSTLALKWVPAQQAPGWLGALTQLQHLLYDPYLPADAPGVLPRSISALTSLKTLVVPRRLRYPAPIPPTLTNLETLHMQGPGYGVALDQDWGWLGRMMKLRSLRLQCAGLRELPDALCSLTMLTRLELMCNQLTDLPTGAYLKNLEFLHVGNNNLCDFPPALRSACALRVLYLANQRTDLDVRKVEAKLAMTRDDVVALAAAHRTLHTIVLGLAQPQIELWAAAPMAVHRTAPRQHQQAKQDLTPHSQQGSSIPSPCGCEVGSSTGIAAMEYCCLAENAFRAPASGTAARPDDGGIEGAGSGFSHGNGADVKGLQQPPIASISSPLVPTPFLEDPGPESHIGRPLDSQEGRNVPAPRLAPPQVELQHGQQVEDGAQAKRLVGFDWLQRVLRKRGIRVTSNELAYEFDRFEVFDLKHVSVAAAPT